MATPKQWICMGLLLLTGCAPNYAGNSTNYGPYNCNQIAREKDALTDQMTKATDKQNGNDIYQLAIAAFALSNGDSYNARSNTETIDHLNYQYDELRHEAIRKQCPF